MGPTVTEHLIKSIKPVSVCEPLPVGLAVEPLHRRLRGRLQSHRGVTACVVFVTVVDCGSPRTVDMADVVFGNHDNSTLLGSTVRYVCREERLQLHDNISRFLVVWTRFCRAQQSSR